MDVKRIGIDGNWITYRERGAGDPVVLVHGWTGSSYDWVKLIPLLAARRRVIAYDQLGFGHSDKPRLDYRLETLTGLLAKVAAGLGLGPFHLVGNSMGGHVAAAFALEHPELVRSLTLADPGGVREGAPWVFKLGRFGRTAEALFRLMPYPVYRVYYRNLGPYHDPRWLTEEDVRGHYHSFGNAAGAFAAARCLKNIVTGPAAQLDRRLSGIRVPTLIVWGRQDPLLPMRMSEPFLREVPGARRALLDYCGHCPQEERPEELKQRLEEFWEECV